MTMMWTELELELRWLLTGSDDLDVSDERRRTNVSKVRREGKGTWNKRALGRSGCARMHTPMVSRGRVDISAPCLGAA